jgi:LPS-assembly lipoprotein
MLGLGSVAALSISGCGFRPLYGTNSLTASPAVVEAMAQMRIRPIADRSGQRLRQILNEQVHTNGPAEKSLYDLDIVLNKQIVELGVRPDSTTSRANLIISATFSVFEGGTRLFGDTTQAVVSYNILDDQFATIASQAAAEDRALKQLGDDIKTRIAVAFDRRFKPRKD